jgi:hypothetical protein
VRQVSRSGRRRCVNRMASEIPPTKLVDRSYLAYTADPVRSSQNPTNEETV